MSDARWPSLYNWGIEVFPIEGKAPVQPGGIYLYDSHEIFRYTLYWTLVFYAPAYVLCAICAFLNVTFPSTRTGKFRLKTRPSLPLQLSSSYLSATQAGAGDEFPMSFRSVVSHGRNDAPSPSPEMMAILSRHYRARLKPNEKRSRVTVALLVFLTFLLFSVAGAVVGSAVIGYVLAGLFKAGHFNMSTWVPFLGGLLQTLVGLLGLWPSVVDII